MNKSKMCGGSPASSRVMGYNRKMVGGSTASSLVMENLNANLSGECKLTDPPVTTIGGDVSKLNLYATSGGGRKSKSRRSRKSKSRKSQKGGGSSDFVSMYYATEVGKVDPSSMHGADNKTIEAYNSDPNLMGSTYAAVGGAKKKSKSKSKSSKSRKH